MVPAIFLPLRQTVGFITRGLSGHARCLHPPRRRAFMALRQIEPLPILAPTNERGAEALTVVAIVCVTILSLVAFFVAGITFLRRYRRTEASTLQARVAKVIATDVDCARVDVVTVAGPSASIAASVTL